MASQASKGSFTNRFKSRKSIIIIAIIGIVFLCCIVTLIIGLIRSSTPEGKATSTARAEIQQATQTEKAQPTNTQLSTNLPAPTNTTIPTNTPAPTYTTKPSNTPAPTNTPTMTLTPIVLTGSGDSIVDVETSGPALVHIVGNDSSRFFAVINYDANNRQIDLLVNTTDPYDGVRPLDFLDSDHTARFEVQATGSWTIEVLPLSTIHKLDIPGEISGKGDYVFAITGGTPDTAIVTGNADSRFFAVLGWGNTRDLLVNTTDPYSGTVLLNSDTIIIEVQAEGEWTMSFTIR
jgi:hypothetical protein